MQSEEKKKVKNKKRAVIVSQIVFCLRLINEMREIKPFLSTIKTILEGVDAL